MISTFWEMLRTRPKKSLEFLARLLDPICVYDTQGQPIYASQKFLDLIRASAREVSFFDYFRSESTALTEYWNHALQGETIGFLSTIRDTHESIECSLQFNPDTQLMFLTAKPISHAWVRQLTEEYERLILMLFNSPTVATALITLDGTLVKANQRLHTLLGIDAEEAIDITEFTHPDDRWIDIDLQKTLLAGDIESYTIEKRLIDTHQEIVWVNATLSLVNMPIPMNGHKQYIAVLLEDITETKKTYSALIRTEGKWKALVLNSLTLFMQISSSKRVVYASPAVEHLLGYGGEELLDLPIAALIHPDDLNEFELMLYFWAEEIVSSRASMECRWKTRSGQWVYLYIQGQPFPTALEIDGLAISGYNVSDRKQAEADLQRSEAINRAIVRVLPNLMI